MKTTHRGSAGAWQILAVAVIVAAVAMADSGDLQPPAPDALLSVGTTADGFSLSFNGNAPFRTTQSEIRNERLVAMPGSSTHLITWDELAAGGQTLPFYAISLDGATMATVRQTSYVLKLRSGNCDPLVAVPPPAAGLAASDASNLCIVQFITQPLEEFRTEISRLGGKVHKYIAQHAHLVEMTPAVRDAVAKLPYVRWIGPVHPAYKLEEEILRQISGGGGLSAARDAKEPDPQRYSIMLNERGIAAQDRVCDYIRSIDGVVHGTTPQGFRIEATLSLDQVQNVARLDDVLFIDRKGAIEIDMDIVREIGGADYLESVAGYTGLGVRAEVADTELDEDHPEWGAPPIIHRAGTDVAHGTSVYGILFAQGVTPQARGLIPDGTGIFACSTNGLLGGGTTRYDHTAELVDPYGPYRTVLQTNSTGDARTFDYTTISAEMDDMLFIYDIVLTQSQSNAGNQDSRPQAWAKNIISGGAVYHYNTLTRNDDCWCYGGSIGPAADGRIKPDLCFFYDDTYTATAGGGYTEFGGTSGATPSIAGHVCLFFQMWADGIFGNEVDPAGDVFDNRCHMTTAKAVMINTANQYVFNSPGDDLTRMHQGWGMPDVAYLYDIRDNITILDESEVLGNMETAEYVAYVEPGTPELRVTLVYADTAGVPLAAQHRINDLTLKLVSPTGTTYWGNNGLESGNWSDPDGSSNEIDTVENVFVENPESGMWSVSVIASEVNEDTHVETPELDADFALVLSGGFLATCTSDGRIMLNKTQYACEDQAALRVVDCDLNTDDDVIETVTVVIDSTTEPGGETVLLTETTPNAADFRGAIDVSTIDAVGVLQVSAGDTIIATYEDEDDGTGVPATVTDTALVDCTPPVISNVQVIDIEPRSAVVTFETDEPTVGSVRYGESCEDLSGYAAQSGYGTDHSVLLSGLSDAASYSFVVDAADEAGNATTDDNGGSCYTFSTPDIPDFFTELFGSGNDLDYLTLLFTPNASVDFYAGCAEAIAALPTDPAGGTSVSLDDDSYQMVSVGGGESVSIYGNSYTSFCIGSNGYITFGIGDTDYSETLIDHFDQPRISALFDDLNPSLGGTVSWKQEADRMVVTYEGVYEYGTTNPNTFQIEMYFNGDIRISYLALSVDDGLAGLSEGVGLDPDYYASDLSGIGACGPRPPTAVDGEVSTSANSPITITLAAIDDGLPEPPALDFIINTLPAHGELSDPGAGVIDSVPYTLIDNGDQAVYTPDNWYMGDDDFEFYANDGGDPPEGGDSNIASVLVHVTIPAPEPVISFPLDTDPGWSTTGEWAFGQPTGGGSHNQDPASGHTGDNVYGYNLDGDYSNDMPAYSLTTTAIDCRDVLTTELHFWRWLGVEAAPSDAATVAISNNGLSWTPLWANPTSTIIDSEWVEMVFDISAVADDQPTVYVRWGMGPTNSSMTYPGWNIDDIEIWGVDTSSPCPGDLDGDGDVDLSDLSQLLANYGTTSGAEYEDGDLDGDGDVDLSDLSALLAVYGTSC